MFQASYIRESDSETEEIKEEHETETLKLGATCRDFTSDDDSDDIKSELKKFSEFSDDESSPINNTKVIHALSIDALIFLR